MSKPTIERSNEHGKFSLSEIRAAVAESKRFWASPAGIAEQRRLDQRQREVRGRGVKFPDLAAKGTKPVIGDARAYWQRRAAAIEARAPKI